MAANAKRNLREIRRQKSSRCRRNISELSPAIGPKLKEESLRVFSWTHAQGHFGILLPTSQGSLHCPFRSGSVAHTVNPSSVHTVLILQAHRMTSEWGLLFHLDCKGFDRNPKGPRADLSPVRVTAGHAYRANAP